MSATDMKTGTDCAVAVRGSTGRRRPIVSLVALLLAAGVLAFGTEAGTAHAVAGPNPCTLLIVSGTPGVPPGPDEPILNSCVDGHCFSKYTDSSGQTKCAYARGAFVKVQCAGTARQARAFVGTQLRRGYRRVKVGADIAGIVASPKGAGVVLAVGRAIVLFTEGASSDENQHPVFPGVRRDVIKGARKMTPVLRNSSVC